MNAVLQLSRVIMICGNPDRLADFYQSIFGFERTGKSSITEPDFAALMGIPGAMARVITLRLGEQEVELLGVRPPGQSYPPAVSGRSPLFQHFAIVVSDMPTVYARLAAEPGWRPISTDGPQVLPAASGGVTAYKFRDPEGHPLELLAFAPDALPARWQKASATGCLGIDHSAISIADTDQSVHFYERLGLRRAGGSLNFGPEQDKLDDIAGALVEVNALAPPDFSTPHIELLCYQGDVDHKLAPPGTNDLAATQIVLRVGNEVILEKLCAQSPDAILSDPVRFENGALRAMLRDPDGHLLCLEAS